MGNLGIDRTVGVVAGLQVQKGRREDSIVVGRFLGEGLGQYDTPGRDQLHPRTSYKGGDEQGLVWPALTMDI